MVVAESQSPILSIIVPTKDRNIYAKSCIKSLLELPSTKIEIIIQDQSSNQELEKHLQTFELDHRLIYYRDPSPANHVISFNLAISHARGEYIIVIGDDDVVQSEILLAVEWAKSHNIDALSPVQCANYCWPDFQHWLYGYEYAAKLRIQKFSGALSRLNPSQEIERYINIPKRDIGGLPKVYHGIIRKACLDDLSRESGGWFFGVSPDVSSGIAVAHYIKSYYAVDYPLIIAGASGQSAAGRGAMGTHKGTLKEDPHMRGFQQLLWPSLLPNFLCVETVLAESAIEGLRAVGDKKNLAQYNYEAVLAMCFLSHLDYFRENLLTLGRLLKFRGGWAPLTIFKLFYYSFIMVVQKIYRIGWRVAHPSAGAGEYTIAGVQDIREAREALEKYLADKGFQWKSENLTP